MQPATSTFVKVRHLQCKLLVQIFCSENSHPFAKYIYRFCAWSSYHPGVNLLVESGTPTNSAYGTPQVASASWRFNLGACSAAVANLLILLHPPRRFASTAGFIRSP
jgi:hypothetical protein